MAIGEAADNGRSLIADSTGRWLFL